MRAFWKALSASSADRSFWSSSIALSWMWLTVPSAPMTNLWAGRLAGGEGRLPRSPDRALPYFDIVLRREPTAMGRGIAMSPASVRAAATAATLADGLVMLFRRVTRWLALRELDSTECELFRECDWREELKLPEDGLTTDKDGRWASGREDCCISCGWKRW
jgi:hypothetical protein